MALIEGPCRHGILQPGRVLHVQDEINAALLEAQHVFGPMARYGGEPHCLERPTQCLRVWTRKLHEFEPVSAERVA